MLKKDKSTATITSSMGVAPGTKKFQAITLKSQII